MKPNVFMAWGVFVGVAGLVLSYAYHPAVALIFTGGALFGKGHGFYEMMKTEAE